MKKWIINSILLLMFLWGCTSPIDTYITKGNYDYAEQKIRQRLSKNPHDDYYNYLLGVVYREKGEYVKAANHFQKAIQQNPHTIYYYLDYAIMLTQYQSPDETRHQKALELLKTCLDFDPYNQLALQELVFIQYTTFKDYWEVIKTADQLLSINHCDKIAVEYRGDAIEALQKMNTAIEYYRWVLDECQNESYRFRLAELLEKNDNGIEAITQWKTYREHMGDHVIYPDTTLAIAEQKLRHLQLKNQTTLQQLANAPSLILLSPSIRTTIDGNTTNFQATILSHYDVADIIINHNDHEIDIENKLTLIQQINDDPNNTLTLSNFPLQAGKNKITIKLIDAIGRKGTETFYFWATGEVKKDDLPPVDTPMNHVYAVLIGISDYQYDDPRYKFYDLDYSHKDAIEMYNILKKQGKIPDENLKLLTDAEATKSEIESAIIWLSGKLQRGPQAMGIIYYSGHGGRIQDEPNYGDEEDGFDEAFLPHDWNPSPNKSIVTAIIDDDFGDLILSWLPVENPKVLIFDACHGSGLPKPGQRIIEQIDPLEPTLPIPNCVLLSASRASEESREDPITGHGAMTARVLEALQSQKTDQNHDQKISLQEIYDYIRPGFYNQFGHTPILKKNNIDPSQIYFLEK